MKVTEDIARYFENFLMRVSVYTTDRETQVETLKESYDLDLSPLLFTKQGEDQL